MSNDDHDQFEKDIDENLRRVFKRKVEEDLPPRLLDIIKKLKSDEDGEEKS